MRVRAALLGCALCTPLAAFAQESDSDIAKKLANPVASLISVPFQHNLDCCFGPDDALRYTLNLQPVIPVPLGERWTVVTRTIVPTIYQEAPVSLLDDKFGLGDAQQSFFFTPGPTADGVTWALGPIVLWPTATEDELGSGKFGAGPTGLLLRQDAGWTYGVLANHIWSYASVDDAHPDDVSSTFIQPFINYTFPNTTSLILNTESSYDWEADEWTVPINAGVSRIFKFGAQPVSLGVQGRYYAVSPDDGPEWGVRFVSTFLFPGK
jgi:hypothetical protein